MLLDTASVLVRAWTRVGLPHKTPLSQRFERNVVLGASTLRACTALFSATHRSNRWPSAVPARNAPYWLSVSQTLRSTTFDEPLPNKPRLPSANRRFSSSQENTPASSSVWAEVLPRLNFEPLGLPTMRTGRPAAPESNAVATVETLVA